MVNKDSVAYDIYRQLMNGAEFDSLARKYTRRPSLQNKNGHHGIQNVEGNELAEKAYSLSKNGDISQPFQSGSKWSIVRLNEKDPARLKTYEEARAEAASDYQEKLVKDYEEIYINKLMDLYKPKYNYEVLKLAFNENIN
jgi:parvulin-like peptidyl-prolyl isomerase